MDTPLPIIEKRIKTSIMRCETSTICADSKRGADALVRMASRAQRHTVCVLTPRRTHGDADPDMESG